MCESCSIDIIYVFKRIAQCIRRLLLARALSYEVFDPRGKAYKHEIFMLEKL